MMRKIFIMLLMLAGACITNAQKVDSIFFHLYTDSLKKGTYNYINVDGKLSNGRWLPLTAKEIDFTASVGRFEGNSLFIAKELQEQRILIKAVLKADTSVAKETVIYIKRIETAEQLPTEEQVIRRQGKRKSS